MEPLSALNLKGVSKAFGGVQALDNVDFNVRAGEIHCLAGENGCGKSTLIKIVTGVYECDNADNFELFGQSIEAASPKLSRALGVAVIWQDLALFPHMTVAENIAFDQIVGSGLRKISRKKWREDAQRVLDRLNISLDLDATLNKLPIAQRQIVAVARALVSDARLVFMDEPTASLTQTETDSLLEIVRTLSSQGVAVVFVSHRLAEVLDISERVTVVRDGKLVGVFPTKDMSQSQLGELMTGTTLTPSIKAQDRSEGPVVLETKSLSRRGEFEELSLTVRSGEIVGLIGLIGAGRTELAHCVMGMTQPDTGTIDLDGVAIRPRSIRETISKGVAYVSEDRLSLGLIQAQSISDNTAISVLKTLMNKLGLQSSLKHDKLVKHWVDQLGVKIGAPSDAVSTLSGGNQQRVVLAKWLATKPRLLILDSPTVGVDVGAREGIFQIVRELAEEGLAILLISDEVTEVMFNADRIYHMAHGKIAGEYHPAQTSVAEFEAKIYA